MSKAEKATDAPASPDGGGEKDADGTAPAPKKSKKLILFGALGAVLLLGGGGGAWMMFGGTKAAAHAEAAAEEAPAKEGHGGESGGEEGGEGKEGEHFVDVPAMVVNLRTADGAARFLKVHFVLVPGEKATAEQITAKLPLLLDAYQPFLRELRPEDLSGSAAVYRV